MYSYLGIMVVKGCIYFFNGADKVEEGGFKKLTFRQSGSQAAADIDDSN